MTIPCYTGVNNGSGDWKGKGIAMFVIVVWESDGPRFWVVGRKWSSEYPDARTFNSKRGAIATAKQFGPQATVVQDYGTGDDFTVYPPNWSPLDLD